MYRDPAAAAGSPFKLCEAMAPQVFDVLSDDDEPAPSPMTHDERQRQVQADAQLARREQAKEERKMRQRQEDEQRSIAFATQHNEAEPPPAKRARVADTEERCFHSIVRLQLDQKDAEYKKLFKGYCSTITPIGLEFLESACEDCVTPEAVLKLAGGAEPSAERLASVLNGGRARWDLAEVRELGGSHKEVTLAMWMSKAVYLIRLALAWPELQPWPQIEARAKNKKDLEFEKQLKRLNDDRLFGAEQVGMFPKPGLPWVRDEERRRTFWRSRGRLGIPRPR